MKPYYPLLDLVRFFAAFWVMNFHYLLGLGLTADLHWYRYGNLGVQLFFIVSGFVIVESLKGKSLGEFAKGRFIRLFPLFWILCTATYVLTLIVPHAQSLHFSEYLMSMTMIGDVIEGYIHHGGLIDPSYWTLCIELIFYIGIALFAYLFSYKNIRYFFAGWLVFAAAAFALHGDQNYYVKLGLVSHAPYFIFGGALAFIVTKQAETLFERCFDRVLLLASAAYAVYIHPAALQRYVTPNPYDMGIVTALLIVFFIMIPLLVYLSRYVQDKRAVTALVVVGGLTYPLYLLHQTIGNTITNYVTNTYAVPRIAFVPAFEVVIIGVAYFAYFQDKKLRGFLKRKMV